MTQLVLSLFPGIGLLDMAFEEEGFTVVRGPDLLWGGDIRRFHPPAGKFDGVIGGPPCKCYSPLANVVRAVHGPESVAPDLIPEFVRVVVEAQPEWFLMENVTRAPQPAISGYRDASFLLNTRWLGNSQNRLRRFSFGSRLAWARDIEIRTEALEPFEFEPAVTTNSGGRRADIKLDANGRVRGKQGSADHHRLRGRSIERMCELQGLPTDFLQDAPFTKEAKAIVIGNGVPLAMGRAVAKAVKRAIAPRGAE
jgi:DNA (cytosine-5)-methyltransferase 1